MTERENNTSSGRKCPKCGTELPGNLPPELCPKCLLQAGMAAAPPTGPTGTVVLPDGGASRRGLPQPGEQLGHYLIVRLLGQGGMGSVFEAEDLENGRHVALKVLAHTLDSPEARERFFREGRLAASINHPNSVYIFGTEEIGGTPVIAMELVAGGTLQDRVRAGGPLGVSEAVDCVLQIIAGLEAALRIGILHRDVKPSNCYVDAAGVVKIGDFGLSISTTIRTEPALTAAGLFLGTPAFCSPEQLRGEELNARSDMYSVGATLYYLLTGRTPFEARNVVQLLAIALEQLPPSPRKLRPEVPGGLAKVILRCLEKQPGERFRNYAELARALAPHSSAAPTPATLGLRFLAGVVDQCAAGLVGFAVMLLAFGNFVNFVDAAAKHSPKAFVWMMVGWAFIVLYFTFMEGLWGFTLGKALCRLRVVGPDRNPPGLPRALVRALFYVVAPALPFWILTGGDSTVCLRLSTGANYLLQMSVYLVIALLFCTVRRRNGFAAVHDLVTGTRVISRVALESRPVLSAGETPPINVENKPAVGPYHVLESMGKSAGEEWLLGYDLRLLRKVWIHVVPPGTPPAPAPQRSLGRVGRLRWLTGRRSPEENWDAFECVTGQPLLRLIQQPQPWSQVRFWLKDLAAEISAAEKDGTLPTVLALDRVWITGDSRVKLLDFPAPGLEPTLTPPLSHRMGEDGPAMAGPGEGRFMGKETVADAQRTNRFLNAVVAAALTGRTEAAVKAAADVPVPLPLHAREFLRKLAVSLDTGAVVLALKPLLRRAAAVSRLRRAAVLAGCAAFPVFMAGLTIIGVAMTRQWNRSDPGVMELSILLQQRRHLGFWLMQKEKAGVPLSGGPYKDSRQAGRVADHLVAVFIAGHYRSTITNQASWNSPFSQLMIKGEARQFAEKSVTGNPAPTEKEITEAEAALKPFLPGPEIFKPHPLLIMKVMLAIFVCLPALIAAALFRGGLVLRIAGMACVRRDGVRASRRRVFWRALVAWSPLFLALFGSMQNWYEPRNAALGEAVLCGLVCGLAILSIAMPERGLQDRLAGTWPVPR
jgi:hypothetical protein